MEEILVTDRLDVGVAVGVAVLSLLVLEMAKDRGEVAKE